MQVLHCHRFFLVSPTRGVAPAAAQLVLAVVSAIGGVATQPYREVADIGQGGLQINEPGTFRSLKTLPGSWSDLALVCLIHVGMKPLLHGEDLSLGIGAKYEEVGWLHQG